MKLEDIKAYCLNKWKAYEDYPFGDVPTCIISISSAVRICF